MGGYTLQVNLTDAAGNVHTQSQAITVSAYQALSCETDTRHPLLSPDGDGVNDHLDLAFDIRGTGTKTVTVKIKNDFGTTLKTLFQNEAVMGQSLTVTWYGKDHEETLQSAGDYQLDIALTDTLGQRLTQTVPVMLIGDNIQVTTTDNGPYFSFNNDGVQDTLTVDVTAVYPSIINNNQYYNPSLNVTVSWIQAGNVVAESQVHLTDKTTLSYTGEGVSEGDFTLKLTGQDGNQVPLTPVTLSYHNDVSIASTITHTLKEASSPALWVSEPYLFNETEIDFSIQAAGATQLTLYDDHLNPVKTVQTIDGVGVFPQVLVTEGSHTYRVDGLDLSGNRVPTQTIDFQVDVTIAKPYFDLASDLINDTTFTSG